MQCAPTHAPQGMSPTCCTLCSTSPKCTTPSTLTPGLYKFHPRHQTLHPTLQASIGQRHLLQPNTQDAEPKAPDTEPLTLQCVSSCTPPAAPQDPRRQTQKLSHAPQSSMIFESHLLHLVLHISKECAPLQPSVGRHVCHLALVLR